MKQRDVLVDCTNQFPHTPFFAPQLPDTPSALRSHACSFPAPLALPFLSTRVQILLLDILGTYVHGVIVQVFEPPLVRRQPASRHWARQNRSRQVLYKLIDTRKHLRNSHMVFPRALEKLRRAGQAISSTHRIEYACRVKTSCNILSISNLSEV